MIDLNLVVDDSLGRRAGLEAALRDAVRDGLLHPGSSLPSSRALAADLGFSRATVVAAFEQLTAEGYLISAQGKQTVVAEVGRPVAEPEPSPSLGPARESFAADFRPGEPDGSTFPRTQWLRSVRTAVTNLPDDGFGYNDPQGVPVLRQSLAAYLARSRSVVASPAAVSVFPGVASALGFLADTFLALGIHTIAVEDPWLFAWRSIFKACGMTVVPIPLDADGLDVTALGKTDARAVLVTPAHQYPLGMTMSAARRSELIGWARECDGWIIEDDYDGEFRYDRQPVGALQGLDSSRIIYAGTASKSLSPALRMAWLVVPPDLRGPLARSKHLRGGGSTIDQHALCDFIERGQLDRHLRTVRALYRDRQRQLAERLTAEVPAVSLSGDQAGLHLTCFLPNGVDEAGLVGRAAEEGIGLFGLGIHWLGPPTSTGLVLGYSRPAQHRFPSALDQLIEFLVREL